MQSRIMSMNRSRSKGLRMELQTTLAGILSTHRLRAEVKTIRASRLVAAAATLTITWIGERAVWVYVATLWLGGLKVWLGTLRPIAEVDDVQIVLRPLHNLRARVIAWSAVSGTEQMTGGDRLIVYF